MSYECYEYTREEARHRVALKHELRGYGVEFEIMASTVDLEAGLQRVRKHEALRQSLIRQLRSLGGAVDPEAGVMELEENLAIRLK